jgi:hypothetical protein
MTTEEAAECRRTRALFDAAMAEDEDIRIGGRTPVERLRRQYDLSPNEELPFSGDGYRPERLID